MCKKNDFTNECMSKSITILYVDDEPVNLELFTIHFEQKYKIETARSGIEGLEKLKSSKSIGVVISDLTMPVMHGLEFIQLAKKEHPHIIYIILTGCDLTSEIIDALNIGLINNCLYKPFDLIAIDKTIEDAIGFFCSNK